MTQPPFLLPAAVVAIVTLTAVAAESREAQDEGDEIAQELAALREAFDAIKASYEARLSALETKLETMQKESSLDVEEELERLEERHDRDREALEGEIDKNRRAFAPLAFTPSITMFGNLMGRRDDKTVISPEGDRIDNRFVFRAGEFELRAAVDPFADAFLAIPLEAESPGGPLEADIEEGYVLMKRLPFVGSPWGLKLKPGKYRPEIGKNNLIHFHDLMWTSRPLPVATFLGTEGLGESAEAGFQVTGVNADFFLPSPSLETTLRMQLGVGTTGNLAVTEANQGDDPVFYGHGSWYQTVTDSQAFELGGSYLRGKNDPSGNLQAALAVADFTYTWKPARSGLRRSFVGGGEFFHASLEQSDGPSKTPLGYYLFAQVQLARNLYLGGRYDFSQELENERLDTRVWAGYLTYYTSEFLRFRLGGEHRLSDLPEKDGLNTLFFELNFVFGVHPTEPYWVNR